MFDKVYTVRQIDGDYAHLVDKESGEEILVAMALLPMETDEGDTLEYKNFQYSIL